MLTVQAGTFTFTCVVSRGDIALHCFGYELDVLWRRRDGVAGIHWNHTDDRTKDRHWTWAEVRGMLAFWR